MNRTFLLIMLCAAVTVLPGCKAPSINLATNEPIKVDIEMRLDVYQHSGDTKPAAKPSATTTAAPAPQAEMRRRNRMADIQVMKDNRLIGENKDGLITIREQVVGEYGDYVREAVQAENTDRMQQMKQMSETQKIPLPDIQKKQAELFRNRAFENEWIEAPGENGTYSWVQKK